MRLRQRLAPVAAAAEATRDQTQAKSGVHSHGAERFRDRPSMRWTRSIRLKRTPGA